MEQAQPDDQVQAEFGDAPVEQQAEQEGDSVLENLTDSEVLDLSDELKTKIAAQIDNDWSSADADRTDWMKKAEEGLRLYWGIIDVKSFPFKGCANLHVPLIRTISDTLHSNIMGSIDINKPVSVVPVGPEDVPKARKAEKLLNWQFTAQVDYGDLADKIVNTCLIFGHAPVKIRYVIEKSQGKKTYDGLRVDVITPERFLMPPDASDADVQSMDYVMQEIPMTKSDLLKRMQAGMYDPIPKEELEKLGGGETKHNREADRMLENVRELYAGTDSDPTERKGKRYMTAIEWHGSFDINDDGIDERIMVSYLKEGRKILRAVRQPKKRPFVIVRFSQILDKATGESLPDLLRHLNQELNTLHNQRVDAVTLTNIPFFFFDPVAGFDPNAITLTPGLGIPVNGSPSQAVYFPQMQTSRPEMYREEDNIFQYAERMLGAGTNAQGITESKRVTATEVATTDRRAGIRFLTIFNRIKKGLREIFNIALELDKDNMPAEMQVRVIGIDSDKPLFETMTPGDIDAKLDIVVNGSSVIDQQAEKTEMMQAYQLGMSNPLIMRDEMAIYELTRDLFLKFDIKKVDAYLRKPADMIPKNPNEEHNLFLQEEDTKPNIAENIEDHLNKHADFINSDKFALLSPKGQGLMMGHYNNTVRMQQVLKQMALVQQMQQVQAMQMAGPGGQGGQQPQSPGGMVPSQVPGPQAHP